MKFKIKNEQDDIEILKANNEIIISSLKTLCEILREHNKRFTITSSNSNIELGTTLHQPKELEIHTSIINEINKVIETLETPPAISEVYCNIRSALDSSVMILNK